MNALQKALEGKENFLSVHLRDYYLLEYPDDEDGAGIRPDVTFGTLADVLIHCEANAAYVVIGEADTLIRERLFAGLAEGIGVECDVVYDQWGKPDNDIRNTLHI